MGTLEQLRSGLSKAWESVADGWRELVDRAGDALTRFHPAHSNSELETADDRVARAASRWGVMPAEVVLGDDEVTVAMEVPGMESDDFDIRVVDDVLVVRGEKKVRREETRGEYHIMERAYGRFERALRLPVGVDDERAKASYERGVLRIRIPRSAPADKVRRIEVTRA